MKRGDLYRVFKPGNPDPKNYRVFVVISRQVVIDSRYSTVVCVPVYTSYDGLSTQVPVGVEEGLRHHSAIQCDNLVSLPKTLLTNFLGTLAEEKIEQLSEVLKIALALD